MSLSVSAERLLGILEQSYTHERLGYRHEVIFVWVAQLPQSVPSGPQEGNHPTWLPLQTLDQIDLRPNSLKKLIPE